MSRSRVRLAACPALIIGAGALLCAQDKPQDKPQGKPAVINVQAAILSTGEGRQSTQALSATYATRKQALEKRQQDIAALQARMRSGSATMSQAAREKLMADIDAQVKTWNRDSTEFNGEVQEEQGKAMNEVGQKMLPLIEKYALEHGIFMVADVSNPQSPVIWADPSLDITNEIIKVYDQAHPLSPATPATPPPAVKKQ